MPLLLEALCKLHNMCVEDFGLTQPHIDDESMRSMGYQLPGVHLQGDCHGGPAALRFNLSSRLGFQRRKELVDALARS